jgi:RNA polymerase sigma-70 factor (ECF subfamily)
MDTELVGRASIGDAGAFEELLRRQARPMLRFADFVLHDLSAAEDAVQEAYMIAWRRRQTLKDQDAFVPWLRRIVLRECMRWRRRWLRPARGETLAHESSALADPVVQIDIARAVRRLPARLRAVIFLHFYEDATLATLARNLGIPESTAKSRLYEALRRLERLLPGYADEVSVEEAP